METREEFNDEISLLDYIDVLKRRRMVIIMVVAVSVLAAGIISLLSPKIYEARAVIIPSSQPKEQGGMSAIASQLGISAGQTSNVPEIVSLLKSNILKEKVIQKHDLAPVFFSREELAEMSGEGRTWNAIRYLNRIYRVSHNQKEGIIELTAEFKDPKTPADIINSMLTELTDYMSSEAKRVAETNRKYLESLIDKNTDPLIRQKIYSLIAQQIETSMMAEVKENFAFKVLDPPRVPDRKIRPEIRTNIMLSFIVSLFAGIFLAFFIEHVKNVKKQEKK